MNKPNQKISELLSRIMAYFTVLWALFSITMVQAQQQTIYEIDAATTTNSLSQNNILVEDHLGAPHQYGVNNSYFTRDGKPWYPIMGEFHYIRYPHEYWEEEILKMKSAGLSIVATYVFWNAHEYPQGTWDWSGDQDLRKFVELCQKHDIYVWLRIGPWSHGEQLHGGHPDWIAKMPHKRTNAPEYLEEAKTLYDQIGKQTKGLYYKNGGPIIGVQLENEYASGKAEHMDALKKMALDAKIQPVYFTITANTVFHDKEFGMIPLQGAYPYRGWESGGGGPTKDFLYGNDQWILGDALGKLYYDPSDYPRGLCEQGCGSQMTYENRFTVEPHVVEAHLQNQIGRGMNLIGYYMFHGGTQMPGLKEPGYPESYDFQAPITEFGQLRPSYKYLKILHHFINDFGKELAPMHVVYPKNPVTDEKNTDSLRYVARINGNSGFLFLGNTQVRTPMPDKAAKFKIKLPGEVLEFPRKPLILEGETTAILPINLVLGNKVLLKYATAQPLAKFDTPEGAVLVMTEVKGMQVELAFEKNTLKEISTEGWQKDEKDGLLNMIPNDREFKTITVKNLLGAQNTIIVLTREQAEYAWRAKINGQESIIVSKADLFISKDKMEFRQMADPIIEFDIFPRPRGKFHVADQEIAATANNIFGHYRIELEYSDSSLEIIKTVANKAVVTLPKHLPDQLSDLMLNVGYYGSDATASINGKIVTDHLFHGPAWQLGLKRYLGHKKMHFEVNEWSDRITGIEESIVKKIKSNGLILHEITTIPQYRIEVNFKNK